MMYTAKVHDLLPPLIKNLEAEPVLHLFKLLKNLPLKEHTEHTIYLAQVRTPVQVRSSTLQCCQLLNFFQFKHFYGSYSKQTVIFQNENTLTSFQI
jgi:hypothetical protein